MDFILLYAKEKKIKDLVCRSIDIQLDFGTNTKNALKTLVNTSPNEMAMADSIFGYLSTHDCNN